MRTLFGNMAPEWEKAAGALKGIVQVAAIDAGSQKINVQGIQQGFPTIRFLVNGQEEGLQGEDDLRRTSSVSHWKKSRRYRYQPTKIAFERMNEPTSSGSDDSSSGVGEDDVIVLSDATFDERVLNDDGPWFV